MSQATPSAVPEPRYGDRIARGAAWLDEVRPTWRNEINLDVLDLYSLDKCVLGQLELVEESPGGYNPDLGFDLGVGPGDFDDLTQAWRQYIEATR